MFPRKIALTIAQRESVKACITVFIHALTFRVGSSPLSYRLFLSLPAFCFLGFLFTTLTISHSLLQWPMSIITDARVRRMLMACLATNSTAHY